jgi:hypothetical protein
MDNTEKFRDGWNKIYNKRLDGKEIKVLTEEETESELDLLKSALASRASQYRQHHEKLKAAIEIFTDSIDTDVKVKGYSVGQNHWSIHSFSDALEAFQVPHNEKIQKLGVANTFDFALFLNDWQAAYNDAKANKAPMGPAGQKASDMAHRKPNRVYQQPQIQNTVNMSVAPLLAVLYAGPSEEALNALKAERPDIFEDQKVKNFFHVVHMLKEDKKLETITQNLEDRVRKMSKQSPVDMGFTPNKPEEEPGVAEMAERNIPLHAGPGKVMQEDFIAEQEKQAVDVVKENRQLINENWKKYQEKNKGAKNTEDPEGFSILMG